MPRHRKEEEKEGLLRARGSSSDRDGRSSSLFPILIRFRLQNAATKAVPHSLTGVCMHDKKEQLAVRVDIIPDAPSTMWTAFLESS